MPIVFWAVVILGGIAINFAVKWTKREKYAELAAHMTQSDVTDAQISGATNLGGAVAQGTIPGDFRGGVLY